jgi:hypothetical protein
VLKRRPELSLPGLNAKKPRMVLGLRRVKEGVVSEIQGSMDSGEQLKRCLLSNFILLREWTWIVMMQCSLCRPLGCFCTS